MPYRAPFETFDLSFEFGGREVAIDDLVEDMERAYEVAIALIGDAMVEDLGRGRVPKEPWPILTGLSKGLLGHTDGGFYIDNPSGDGFEIWNRTFYAQWVELGIAGQYPRKDGGRFIAKMWVQNEQKYFDIATDFWGEL